ncbi:CBS / octicosapeptide/Phox/Bemp1 (PB1) domains-containing protein [Artemisia annua]|uniref:CBS / octicosapeptide/Phox/Bemp1 (PB1) domains-containing protein n=1 Tax=Artemisia annua TaxID=35608 RepID=A0A2U1PJ95_ARTAN|nr:CBS / octicosapeptide/Phox/Bemp1 (PB1) domains-containing protein [Artemisia annua]
MVYFYMQMEILLLYITDVLHITRPVVASVGSTAGIDNDAASSMMQKFWDSAMAAPPADDDSEPGSEDSFDMASKAEMDIGKCAWSASLSFYKLAYSGMLRNRKATSAASGGLEQAHPDAWASAYSSVAAGAGLVAGLWCISIHEKSKQH